MEIKKGIQILRQSRHNIIWKAVYFNASGLFLRLWRLPHNQYKSDKFPLIKYDFKYLLVNFGSQKIQFIDCVCWRLLPSKKACHSLLTTKKMFLLCPLCLTAPPTGGGSYVYSGASSAGTVECDCGDDSCPNCNLMLQYGLG